MTAAVLVVVTMTVAEERNNCVGGKGTHIRHRWTCHQDQDRIVRDEIEWAELLAFSEVFWLLSDSKHPANFVHSSLSPSLPPLLEPSLPPSLLFLPYAFTPAIARCCCHRCRHCSLPCCNQPANQPANQPVNQSANQPTNQPANQSATQPFNQEKIYCPTNCQPVSQPAQTSEIPPPQPK